MRNFVPPFASAMQRFIIAAAGSAFALIWIYELANEGRYDWLLISGWLAFILGLWLTHGLPERLEYTLDRLVNRGALAMTPERLNALKQDLERRIVKYWAPISGSVIALAILGAFVFRSRTPLVPNGLPLLLAEIVGGYIAGCYLGRMACYGMLGFLIGAANLRLRVIPGHFDAVAGLKPVGNFYFRQAMVVGIPAMFLPVWLVLIPLPYFQSYAGWQKSYRGLLVLAIIFEALSFMVPLWWFHGEMSKQKLILLKEADELSAEIAEIQRNLVEGRSTDEMKAFREKLEEKTARCRVIEQLPVWPIDLKTKRLFSISNVALVVPLVSEYAGLSNPWAEFLKGSLEKIGSH